MTSEEIAAQHKRSDRGRELIAALPDVYGEDTVVRYFKQFNEGDEDYVYLAVKVAGSQWFQAGDYLSWRELLLRADDDNVYDVATGAIQVATEWTPLTEGE